MELRKGLIVRSLAGNDKGNYEVVMSFDEKYVWLCDGKHRPLERLKKKQLKHVKPTDEILDESLILTNKSIRRQLRAYDKTKNISEMGLKRGAIVYSLAGHDKGYFHIMMDFDDKYAWLCDGKYRPLNRLKKKSLKHVKQTNTVIDESRLLTDESIWSAIREYDKKNIIK